MESHLDHMNLYADENFARIISVAHRHAQAKQTSETGLIPTDLQGVDIMHYTTDFTEILNLLESNPDISTVLDIGSGPGGASRYITHKFPSTSVTNVEYLEELAKLDQDLQSLFKTSGSEFVNRITTVNDDFLKYRLTASPFDLVLSQLCFLHIPDKQRLFAQLGRVTGSFFYLEDWYIQDDTSLAEEDVRILRDDIEVPDGHI
jgi:SAM-dependent methyltransferase